MRTEHRTTRRAFVRQAAGWLTGLSVTAAWTNFPAAAQPQRAPDSPGPQPPSPRTPPAGTSETTEPWAPLPSQAHLPIVDTHQHLWDLKRFPLRWVQRSERLNRSFLLSDYRQAAQGLNIVRTVYMEVAVDPEQKAQEARWALDLCRRERLVGGAVIGGLPESPEFATHVRTFAKDPYLKGVRRILHGGTPAGLCLQRQFVENIRLLGELGLRFDLCMRPGELLDGVRLVDQCPKTRFVVDHCGNLSVQSTDRRLRARWQKGLRELAQRPHVVCKISGIVATAPENWTPADLEPNITFCLETFGEDRVVFASDWPVCTRRATLRQWVNALKWIVRDQPVEKQKKLFHDNAVRFYELS